MRRREAAATAQREVSASEAALLPKPENFPEPWVLRNGAQSDAAKAMVIRLAGSHIARVLTREQLQQCVDKLVMWGAVYMLYRHVAGAPGALTVADVVSWVPVALYITVVFECGHIVAPQALGLNRARIMRGVSELPSPYGLPLRQELFERINAHLVKTALARWLARDEGGRADGVGRVLSRNVRAIQAGRPVADADVRYRWRRCVVDRSHRDAPPAR